ncbi:hypothetical protein BDP27DRAFT_1423453 [Rhodocollybia butyracea]|uniref:NADH-ubiquinone oxidoreductase B15 subunit n=1 Tax=Rhodocollybia butyracea TaxID=206335 RepID=A0A9P5PP10_9AGAR|nr:hypothetical protein BDP27DRAFT_1423453 [Rhodocollybia butyracea]
MAGGVLKTEKAIENHNIWREQHYLRFRWTPASVKTAVVAFIVFPTALYTAISYSSNRWTWNAKLKDQPLAG